MISNGSGKPGTGSVRSQMFVKKQAIIHLCRPSGAECGPLYRAAIDFAHSAPLGRRVSCQVSCSINIGLLVEPTPMTDRLLRLRFLPIPCLPFRVEFPCPKYN